MFLKKSEKKGHPYIAVMIGALAFIGAVCVKNCGMNFIKSKCKSVTSFMKGEKSGACECDAASE